MEAADMAWDLRSVVKIDGIKGANGSLLPYGDLPLAGLSSCRRHFLLVIGTISHQFIQFLGTFWYPTPPHMFLTKI